MNVDKSDLRKILATLRNCEFYFKARDTANAAIHLGAPIYSPLTSDVIRSTARLGFIVNSIEEAEHECP